MGLQLGFFEFLDYGYFLEELLLFLVDFIEKLVILGFGFFKFIFEEFELVFGVMGLVFDQFGLLSDVFDVVVDPLNFGFELGDFVIFVVFLGVGEFSRLVGN